MPIGGRQIFNDFLEIHPVRLDAPLICGGCGNCNSEYHRHLFGAILPHLIRPTLVLALSGQFPCPKGGFGLCLHLQSTTTVLTASHTTCQKMGDGVLEKADHGNNGSPSPEKHSTEVGELRTRAVAFRPQERLLHDPNVTFEEYMYYAAMSRAEEDAGAASRPKMGLVDVLLPSKNGGIRELKGSATSSSEAIHELNLSDPKIRATISEEEWTNASRALRTATSAACFYLITTDILGPYGVGFALGTMGWGQGFGLYTIFGACAGL